MANEFLKFKPSKPKFGSTTLKSGSISDLVFSLDCPKILSNTPLDPQIHIQRQKVCAVSELMAVLGVSRADLEIDLLSLGMDPSSLLDFASLELHVARLTPHSRFPPHFHFLSHEVYFGLQGTGLMRIGLPLQNGNVVTSREQLNPAIPLSCEWSSERTQPFPVGAVFLVKAGEVHSLTNDASSELVTAFICSNKHLDDAKDRVRLPPKA